MQQIDHIIPFFIVSGAYELDRRIWLRKARYIIKESTLAVRMDSDLKEQVEPLYEQMGTLSYNNYTIFDNGYNKTFRRNGTDT